ncbi:MAG: hypothetical protein R2729_16250 [Bryobacteraceae bacterium]
MKPLALALAAAALGAQTFEQRGFFEMRGTVYPQTAPGDSGRGVAEGFLRWEGSYEANRSVKFFGGVDARTDSHRMTEREFRLDWRDRRALRPAISLRRASVAWYRGGFTLEVGKQFIRWGKADILNPTDRFAPRDYLSVTDNEFLGVTAARATWESGSHSIDLVAQPLFTPSRTPLLNQRWAPLPAEVREVRIIDDGAAIPGRTQFGARWNHVGRGHETSLVFYDGFHYLPLVTPQIDFRNQALRLSRYHPQLRLYGADTAVALPWFTVKAEAAYFTSKTPQADEYVLYVVQGERTVGEWIFVGGYAGEHVTQRRNPLAFAPDRGFAKSFLGRAAYTLGPRRSAALEAAVRENGDGLWLRFEYSEEFSPHWRLTTAVVLIRGHETDFLGQFRRNSHWSTAFRYSF